VARVWSLDDLDVIPRRGWLDQPTPVTPLPRVAAALGLEHLAVKRDDLCGPLFGGTKPRKLDYLLASPPFAEAEAWAATGGIGSGNVVAVTAAAQELGRKAHAHLFWTPISAGILDNLAFTASGAETLTFYGSRVALALKSPGLVLSAAPSSDGGGIPAIAPGATSPLGMVGLVRAALELREQVRAGELPEPARLYVPLGSGGTAAGLSVGLGLAGLRTAVVAVAVVERPLALGSRLRALQRQLVALLEAQGIRPVPPPAPLVIERGHLGRGYAVPTAEALAACELLASEGLTLEPVYAGKAMAGLLADAAHAAHAAHAARKRLGPVLFWQTARRSPLPRDERWRERLPPALAKRIADPGAARVGRRRVLVGLGAAAAAGVLGARFLGGYPDLPGFRGAVLSEREAHIVAAAAEALLPAEATAAERGEIAPRLDRYLNGMSARTLREVSAMLLLVEHGTSALGGRLRRFTSLDPAARSVYLAGLEARGGLISQAYRGLRDLVMLAYYQQPSTWAALGYEGPRVPLDHDPRGKLRADWPAYDAMVAPRGAVPRGATG